MNVNANWLAAPVVLPLMAAAVSLLVSTRVTPKQTRIQRNVAILAAAGNLLVALFLLWLTAGGDQRIVLQVGLWPAPFGITLVADAFSAIMLTLTGLLMLCLVVFASGTLDERQGLNFYPLLLFLLMGVNGAFVAGDLFNLYVFFEVLLMASFVLLSLGGRPAQVNGGLRYVLLNLLASTVFLATTGVVYGTLGTLNLAHLAERMDAAPDWLRIVIAGMLLVAYGSKAGIFPLFFWLPASYHTPHPAVTAIFGGLLTKVGIYALFRIYPLLFPDLLVEWQPLILTIAALTMLVGVFGAMAVKTIRRVLSFHVISQVGYMVMGLGLALSGNQLAAGFGMAAGIFYIVHHMIVKTALLMAGGAAELTMGTGRLEKGYLGGLVKRSPVLAGVFFVAAFSLAGIPPSSGFISKLGLLQIALDAQQWWIAGISLLVSLLTLMSMIRLWQKGFAGPQEDVVAPLRRPNLRLTVAPIALLVTASLAIGVFSGPFFEWSSVAARQVLDRQGYIRAVAPTDQILPIGEQSH
ncbi:MAG: Na+/H+ antiporter subunit D [Anaerolineales bacterium]|nr:Na+/H+ antiporter subunit D [Anaerolineales bacterium]MCW5855822.1 Na+/H+ antiporter subunit D [Anaerolineales bacterium]